MAHLGHAGSPQAASAAEISEIAGKRVATGTAQPSAQYKKESQMSSGVQHWTVLCFKL